MLTIVGTLVVLLLVGFGTYSGIREGAFYGTYVFVRTLLGLIMALTFAEPLATLLTSVMNLDPPWYDYLLLISFVVLYAGTTTTIRQFKVRATSPSIPCIGLFDTIYGAGAGFASGVLASGVVLITISLVPALPYMSPSISRFEMTETAIDTGGPTLEFYEFVSTRFGGNTDFPTTAAESEPMKEGEDVNYNDQYDFPGLEAYYDTNGNGQWDRAWLARYRTCWQFGTVEASQADYPLIPPVTED
jgi:hypothetical protein